MDWQTTLRWTLRTVQDNIVRQPVTYEFRTTVIQEYHTRELIGDEINGCEKAEMQAFAEVIRPCVPNVDPCGI